MFIAITRFISVIDVSLKLALRLPVITPGPHATIETELVVALAYLGTFAKSPFLWETQRI